MFRLIASAGVSAADDFVVDDESATWGVSGDGNTLFYVSTEGKASLAFGGVSETFFGTPTAGAV